MFILRGSHWHHEAGVSICARILLLAAKDDSCNVKKWRGLSELFSRVSVLLHRRGSGNTLYLDLLDLQTQTLIIGRPGIR